MPLYPRLHTQPTEQEMIDGFGGYDHRLRIADGAWFDTENLSSDLAPMLSVRRPRGNTHLRAAALLEKDALAYVSEDGTLYYNFLPTAVTGLSAAPKQIVGMGAYLVIFPDKVYFNTADETDWGSLEAHFAPQSASYELCRFDGTALRADSIQPLEPDAPQNAQYWIDTSGERNVLRQWSEAQGEWVTVETAYVRIGFETRGVVPKLFSAGDGVSVSGSSLGEVNGEKLLAAVGGGEGESDWVVVTGLPAHLPDEPDTALRIDRSAPEPDFVCECQNRLWGCRYGLDEGGRPVNEIFCCALGDFKNWRQFRGLATDSWVGSVGSDGQWTGAVNYLGSPTFFKENRIHRVGISPEGAHTISETVCRGVQKGSEKSLRVVNETLYYKSRSDVCAYQGGFPAGVSAPLGTKSYHGAVAGEARGKYYLSMLDEDETPSLFVYDIAKGLWLREDALRVTDFARVDDELYAIADGELITLFGSLPVAGSTREETVTWQAVSGLLCYRYPENKRVSRYNIRLSLAQGAMMEVYVQYDSDGVWRSAGGITAAKDMTDACLFPVRPHRCDHLQLKLSGQGEVRILSISRILELGSDYR